MPVPSPSLLLRRAAAATLVPVLGALGLAATAAPAHAVDTTSPVVISEVYGGGGNTGAPYRNDFIELYNHGAASVDLSTWSVQYASATGTSWAVTNLVGHHRARGVLPRAGGRRRPARPAHAADARRHRAHRHVRHRRQGGPREHPHRTARCALDAAACSTAPGVVDFVGFGTANDAAGGTPTPALSNTTSAQRTLAAVQRTPGQRGRLHRGRAHPQGGAGDGHPAAEPLRRDPAARRSASPGLRRIQDIQGAGFLSPLKGQTVDQGRRRRHRRAHAPAAAGSGCSRPTPTPRVPRAPPASSSSPRARPPSRSATRCSSPAPSRDYYPLARARPPRPPPTCRRPRSPGHHGHRRQLRATRCRRRSSSRRRRVPEPVCAGLPADTRQHRDHRPRRPDELGAGVLGGPRGHARHGQRRPRRRARASRSTARST